MDEVEIGARLQSVLAAGLRNRVEELDAVLVRLGFARNREGVAILSHRRRRSQSERSGRGVRAIGLKVARPLEMQRIRRARGQTLSQSATRNRSWKFAVPCSAANRCSAPRRVVPIRLVRSPATGSCRKVVLSVQLVIELGEENVLLDDAREGADLVRQELGGRRALRLASEETGNSRSESTSQMPAASAADVDDV